ncbi:MAG: hypothetical protein Q6370_013400, partial [Candidatus Sigynarchaeota archaeon]
MRGGDHLKLDVANIRLNMPPSGTSPQSMRPAFCKTWIMTSFDGSVTAARTGIGRASSTSYIEIVCRLAGQQDPLARHAV